VKLIISVPRFFYVLINNFCSSAAARQITLNPPKTTASTGDNNEDSLCVLIFEPLVGSEYAVSSCVCILHEDCESNLTYSLSLYKNLGNF
jgi:hypothetical protein